MARQTPAALRPVAKCRDLALVEKRRNLIVEAATRLAAERGFSKTSMRDIAEDIQISSGLIYEYVRTKEDVLFLVFEHWSAVWANGLRAAIGAAEDPFDRLYAAVDFLVGAADRHPEVPHLLYRESGNLDEQGLKMFKECELDQIGIVREVVDDAVRSGDLRPDANVELIATSIVFLTTAWALKGWLLRRSQKPRSYVDFVVAGLFEGSGTEKGVARSQARRR